MTALTPAERSARARARRRESGTAELRMQITPGLRQMLDLGYMPVAWETPHYVGSPSTLQAVAQILGILS